MLLYNMKFSLGKGFEVALPPSSLLGNYLKDCFLDVNNVESNIKYHPLYQMLIESGIILRSWQCFLEIGTIVRNDSFIFFMRSKSYSDRLDEYGFCCNISRVYSSHKSNFHLEWQLRLDWSSRSLCAITLHYNAI